MGFINTKDDLKRFVVECVERKCKASSLPLPLRKVSAEYSRCWTRIGVTPRELCNELHAEGRLELYEPVRGGTLVLSLSLIEHMKSRYVTQTGTEFNKTMEYYDILTKFADQALALHSPSRKST